MTVAIRIEPETGVAVATCSGVLGPGDARAGVTELWNAPGWSGVAAVWDFRHAQFDMSAADIRAVAEYVLQNQPATPASRVAFVTEREVDFGMARMFEVFREDPRTAFEVFRDYHEALNWARSGESGEG